MSADPPEGCICSCGRWESSSCQREMCHDLKVWNDSSDVAAKCGTWTVQSLRLSCLSHNHEKTLQKKKKWHNFTGLESLVVSLYCILPGNGVCIILTSYKVNILHLYSSSHLSFISQVLCQGFPGPPLYFLKASLSDSVYQMYAGFFLSLHFFCPPLVRYSLFHKPCWHMSNYRLK